MAAFDTLLIAPTDAALVEALAAAAAAANREVALLPMGRAVWWEFAPQLRFHGEGRRQWSDAKGGDTARVGCAWWTDAAGRIHARVVGGNSRDGSYPRLTATHADPRPPLWHVHPERVFFRSVAGRDEWVGACACGVAGPPGAVGWMGERCAACHDRREEGLLDVPAPLYARAFTTVPLADCTVLRFSQGGRLLATLRSPGPDLSTVVVLDLRSGAEQELPTARGAPNATAFSPDGRLFASTEGVDRMLVYDLEAERFVLRHDEAFAPGPLAFSPDGRTLAAATANGLQLWAVGAPPGEWGPGELLRPAVTAVAFAPDGRTFAAAEAGAVVLYRLAEGGVVTLDRLALGDNYPIRGLAFHEGGRRLSALSLQAPAEYWDVVAVGAELPPWGASQLRFAVESGRLRYDGQRELRQSGHAWLGPDGHLAAVPHDGVAAEVLTPDGTPLGRVGWDTAERLAAAALSPDGETLAVVDEYGGGKLIPWRAVLGATPR